MPRAISSKDKFAEFRDAMSRMETTRLEMFVANAPKYAEGLGAFRAALQKSGFSTEESMQIVLKSMEQPRRGPMFGWRHGGHWR